MQWRYQCNHAHLFACGAVLLELEAMPLLAIAPASAAGQDSAVLLVHAEPPGGAGVCRLAQRQENQGEGPLPQGSAAGPPVAVTSSQDVASCRLIGWQPSGPQGA
jgi:hypothetical protein